MSTLIPLFGLILLLITPEVMASGAFKFALTGPPGVYTVLASPDLTVWSESGVATNQLGFARFIDPTSALTPQKFYRVRSLSLQ